MYHDWTGVFDYGAPFLRIPVYNFIGIQSFRQHGYTNVCLKAGFVSKQSARIKDRILFAIESLASDFQSAYCGFITSCIRVESQYDTAGVAL